MRTADIRINDVGCFYKKSYRNDRMNIDSYRNNMSGDLDNQTAA